MKIAFVWTGFTSYMADCWRALAALPDVKLRVWIEAIDRGDPALEPERLMSGVDFRWQRTDEIDEASCQRTEREIAAFAPDALFVCGWAREWPPYLTRSTLLAAVPKVLCCDMPWEWRMRKFAARFVLWPHVRRFEKVMIPGAAAARYMRWLGFAARDIVRGEYGIDQKRFRSLPRRVERKGFLFIGRHVADKGLDTLERATEIYRSLGGQWDVDVPASVDPSDVPQVMSEHACLILPSRWEPWGVVVLEALSAGLRTIVSDRVGARLDLPVDEVFPCDDAQALAQAMLRVERGATKKRETSLEMYSCENWAQRVVALAACLDRRETTSRCLAAPRDAEERCAKILHVVPGLDEAGNGIAVAAQLIAKAQREAGREVQMLETRAFVRAVIPSLRSHSEIWVHSNWWVPTLLACWQVLRAGVPLVRMTHANLDPVRYRYHGWKKRLVAPIERWLFRKTARVVVTCEAERGWCEQWGVRGPFEIVNLKRFFRLDKGGSCKTRGRDALVASEMERIVLFRRDEMHRRAQLGGNIRRSRTRRARKRVRVASTGEWRFCNWLKGQNGLRADFVSASSLAGNLHVLYLGRRHPLKGVAYLERAVDEVNEEMKGRGRDGNSIELREVSDTFGEALEKVWAWCDVLCLPTLSENFGLVVAEALERGKPVIVTDGAPAWHDLTPNQGCYLKGFRDGTDVERVKLLKDSLLAAIMSSTIVDVRFAATSRF